MDRDDVKLGMKVVPHSKSIGSNDLEEIPYKNFLYVTGYEPLSPYGEDAFCLSRHNVPGTWLSDYFLASDFELYIEPEPKEEIVSPGYPVAYCDQFCYYRFA